MHVGRLGAPTAGSCACRPCCYPAFLAHPVPAQVSLLRRLFKAALGDEAAKLVDINTIDGFQVGSKSNGHAMMGA